MQKTFTEEDTNKFRLEERLKYLPLIDKLKQEILELKEENEELNMLLDKHNVCQA